MTEDKRIKDVVKTIGDMLLLLSNVSRGFSFQEVSELIALIGDARTVMADAPYLLEEYKLLDEAARADLYSYIQSQITFPANTNIELLVEKCLQGVVAISQIFSLFGLK